MLCFNCFVAVCVRLLFLVVPWNGLRFVIVVDLFTGHTNLFFQADFNRFSFYKVIGHIKSHGRFSFAQSLSFNV